MSDNLDGLLSPFLRNRRLAAARPHIKGRVLDFGCGIGLLRERLAGNDYVGIDIDATALSEAQRRFPASRFLRVDELQTLEGEQFDTVAALAVIEHLPDPAGFLAKMKTLLAPGGRIVITTPNPNFDWAHGLGGRLGIFAKESHDEHQSLMDKAGIATHAAAAGLRVVLYRRFLLGVNQIAVLAA